jgi:hypothetical protein
MSDGRTASNTPRLLLRALLRVFAVGGVSIALLNGVQAAGPDYLQFWTIGRAMPLPSYSTLHRRDIPLAPRIDPAIRRAVEAGNEKLYLTATPLYYTVFSLVSGPDFFRSLQLFQAVSLACFVGGLIVMLRQWGYSWDAICLVAGVCGACGAALYDDTSHGNVSRLYVGLMAALLWMFRRRSFAARTAGAYACLALLVLFKPLAAPAVAALLLWRIVAGQWRRATYEMSGLLGGALLGLLLPSWLTGAPLRLWTDFLRIQVHYLDDGDYQSPSIGDASLIESVTGALHLSIIQLAVILAVIGLCAIAIMLVRTSASVRLRVRPPGLADTREDVAAADLAVTLGAASFLLVSPLVWPHYYLLSIVLALFLLRGLIEDGAIEPLGAARRIEAAALVAAFLLLAGNPLVSLDALLLSRRHLKDVSLVEGQLGLGNLLVCGAGLFEYGRRLLLRQRRRQAAGTALKEAS